MNKRILVCSLFGLLTCMLSSCGNEGNSDVKKAVVRVKTMTVSPTLADVGREYSGTIEENTGTELSFATAGTVRQVYVSNGQKVTKGQLIATLDESTLRNAHNAAKSILNQAEDAYARMKKLHDSNSISEMQWVEVQSRLEQAKSSEQMALRALSDTRLVAPASGIITNKNIEPGQNVIPGFTVMKIVEINKVKVNISVPENEVSSIDNGTTVNVTVPALDNARYIGSITEKNVTANTLSRTYNIKATVNNPGLRLMPGMICKAEIDGGNHPNICMVLPVDAVQLNDKNFYFVWVMHNGKARKQFIEVGSVTSTGVTVTSGLNRNDKVIVEGQQKVSESTLVSEK